MHHTLSIYIYIHIYIYVYLIYSKIRFFSNFTQCASKLPNQNKNAPMSKHAKSRQTRSQIRCFSNFTQRASKLPNPKKNAPMSKHAKSRQTRETLPRIDSTPSTQQHHIVEHAPYLFFSFVQHTHPPLPPNNHTPTVVSIFLFRTHTSPLYNHTTTFFDTQSPLPPK